MSKPKFSINERVMVRCHASESSTGESIHIDDCLIANCRILRAGIPISHRGTQITEDVYCYKVDQHPGKWIDQDFIFPYQEPGSSFKEQMQELDKPIKQLEPA